MIQINNLLNEINYFLRTMTIKNNYLADMISDTAIKDSWRTVLPVSMNPYYRHLMGDVILPDDTVSFYITDNTSGTKYLITKTNKELYNESALDTEMFINSLDTGERISFRRDYQAGTFYELHPKTHASYKLPGEYYELVVSEYPDQSDLIKSIVYPLTTAKKPDVVDFSQSTNDYTTTLLNSIEADNFTLLNYDLSQLEANEQESILQCVQQYLGYFKHRWDVVQYTRTENYFPIVQWAIMWYGLFLAIHTQRIKNIRTENVHSFHIWEYLQSKGFKDYRTLLNDTQALWLYKNISYLRANCGKTSNLKILSDVLLGTYTVELQGKSLIMQPVEAHIGENICSQTPIVMTENVDKIESPLKGISEHGFESLDEIINREHSNGLEPVLSDAIVSEQKTLTSRSKYTYLPTKLVEFKTLPIHRKYINLFNKFIVDSMLYYTSLGRFDNEVVKIDFEDYQISISLTYKEGIALAFYLMCKEIGLSPYNIPNKWVSAFSEAYAEKQYSVQQEVYHYTGKRNIEYLLKTNQMISNVPICTEQKASSMDNQYYIEHRAFNKQLWDIKTNTDDSIEASSIFIHKLGRYPSNVNIETINKADMDILFTYENIDKNSIKIKLHVTNITSTKNIVIKVTIKSDTIPITHSDPTLPKDPAVKMDIDTAIELMQKQFAVRLEDEVSKSSNFDIWVALAYDQMYDEFRARKNKVTDLQLVDPKFTLYVEWFNNNEQLRNLVNALENNDIPSSAYRYACAEVLSKLLPTKSEIRYYMTLYDIVDYSQANIDNTANSNNVLYKGNEQRLIKIGDQIEVCDTGVTTNGKTIITRLVVSRVFNFNSFITQIGLDDKQYEQMKQLFMQLCSYYIAFLDKNQESNSYMIRAQICSRYSTESKHTSYLQPCLNSSRDVYLWIRPGYADFFKNWYILHGTDNNNNYITEPIRLNTNIYNNYPEQLALMRPPSVFSGTTKYNITLNTIKFTNSHRLSSSNIMFKRDIINMKNSHKSSNSSYLNFQRLIINSYSVDSNRNMFTRHIPITFFNLSNNN